MLIINHEVVATSSSERSERFFFRKNPTIIEEDNLGFRNYAAAIFNLDRRERGHHRNHLVRPNGLLLSAIFQSQATDRPPLVGIPLQ